MDLYPGMDYLGMMGSEDEDAYSDEDYEESEDEEVDDFDEDEDDGAW